MIWFRKAGFKVCFSFLALIVKIDIYHMFNKDVLLDTLFGK
jgi:hypothetical protein